MFGNDAVTLWECYATVAKSDKQRFDILRNKVHLFSCRCS